MLARVCEGLCCEGGGSLCEGHFDWLSKDVVYLCMLGETPTEGFTGMCNRTVNPPK
jgi:hypothetical protein